MHIFLEQTRMHLNDDANNHDDNNNDDTNLEMKLSTGWPGSTGSAFLGPLMMLTWVEMRFMLVSRLSRVSRHSLRPSSSRFVLTVRLTKVGVKYSTCRTEQVQKIILFKAYAK